MNYVSSGFIKYLGVGVVLVSLFACSIAKAVSSASLSWSPNTDPSIAGYNVYYGGSSRSYTNVVNVGSSTNAVIGGLLEGKTYYFAVTAYTFDGAESDFSAETVYLLPGYLTITPGATPSSPIQIRFPVASDHWYELQQSPDLVSWMTIWQTMGADNVWTEFDVPVSLSGAMYYRVVSH